MKERVVCEDWKNKDNYMQGWVQLWSWSWIESQLQVGVELFWVGVELNFCCEAGVGIGVGVELFWFGVGVGFELFWVKMKKNDLNEKKIIEILQIHYFLIVRMHNS